MPTYRDEGVVLRRVNQGETNRVLTVLMREHGKVGLIARSVRRAQSSLAAASDLFVHSQMQLATGRGQLDVLTQAQLVHQPPRLHDPRRAAAAALCAELADRVLEPHHRDPEVFDLVIQAFRACADERRDPRSAAVWFSQRLIDRLGYAPQLYVCARCHDPLPELPAYFSAGRGGLLDEHCGRLEQHVVLCTIAVIKVLRVIAAGDHNLYERLRLDIAAYDALERIVEHELAAHLDRRLRSWDIFRALVHGHADLLAERAAAAAPGAVD